MSDESSSSATPKETRTTDLLVPEMDCPSCAGKVTNSVERLDGIEELDARVTSRTLAVAYDSALTDEAAIRKRVEAAGYAAVSETEETTLSVPGMDCPSCAGKVERSLAGVSGVESVETQPGAGTVRVVGEDVDERAVVSAVERAGYEATATEAGAAGTGAGTSRRGGERIGDPAAIWRSRRAVATAIGAVFVTVGMGLAFVFTGSNVELATVAGRTFSVSHVLFIVAAAVAGAPIVRNGYYSARNLHLDIDFLMSAGILASVAAHHPFEGAMLAVLFSIAELLERFSMDRARASLRELMDLEPETARRQRADGTEETVPVGRLAVGDRVVVKPGEKVPADGVVTEGESAIDQSPVTGESVPVDRSTGDEVYAGTILEAGYLEVEVTHPADESTIARIVALVEDAEHEKTDREQFVDRFAAIYTPIVVVLAVALATLPPLLAGWSWDTWFLRGLTLLVIACPCAFVIATPVSVVSGITSAARNGVLIKGGRYLEAVGESHVLAVDKTGTLTTGHLSVTDVVALDGAGEDELLRRASAIERRSEHPVGEAIVTAAADRGLDGVTDTDPDDPDRHDSNLDEFDRDDDLEVADFEAVAGRGVTATVDGVRHYIGTSRYLADESALDLEHRHLTDGGTALDLPGGEMDPSGDDEIAERDGRRGEREGCPVGDCVDVDADLVSRLEADGKTVVLVGTDERLLGLIAVADTVRPEAAWAVSRLQEQGVEVVMLTGDNEGTARAIAERVGVDAYHAELLPEEKLDRIRELEAGRGLEADRDLDTDPDAGEPRYVCMVGDGINDAPALATATVGIAMGAAGTDTAIETADVALMGDDLTRLPYLFSLSGGANGVIRQNIYASLAVKAVLAAGAPFGIVTVIHAVVIGDMGMSLGVTGNAMRLANVEPETPE